MPIDEDFVPEIVAEPILIHRDAPLAAPRRQGGSSDTLVVWGAVIVIAGMVGAYALVKASRTEVVAAPAPVPIVVADPAPPARPKPAPAPKRTQPVTPAAPAPKYAPRTVVHVEPEKKVVDPIEGFDTGEAFDNPASPGRYGQRTSGLLERSPAPARPNQPDPSFGRTPQ